MTRANLNLISKIELDSFNLYGIEYVQRSRDLEFYVYLTVITYNCAISIAIWTLLLLR